MKTRDILKKLDGVFATSNGWQAQCPAHDDGRASLCIAQDCGKTLLHCQARCGTKDIVQAMGLQMRDLFPDKPRQQRLVATYDYKNEHGELLYQMVRFHPKAFTARRPNGEGGWINSLDGVTLVPYHLRMILKYPAVVITEGEKDADTASKHLRLASTTNPFGAGKWRPEFAPYFAGKIVVLIPHRDDAGVSTCSWSQLRSCRWRKK